MKKKIIPLLAMFSLFSVIAFASPDYNSPATVTGIVYQLNDETFYVNGYQLYDLNEDQIGLLGSHIGETVTVKGFYEKEYLRGMGPNEVYVTEITSRYYNSELRSSK